MIMEVGKSQDLQSESQPETRRAGPRPRTAAPGEGRDNVSFSSSPRAGKTNISVGRPLGRRNSPLGGGSRGMGKGVQPFCSIR